MHSITVAALSTNIGILTWLQKVLMALDYRSLTLTLKYPKLLLISPLRALLAHLAPNSLNLYSSHQIAPYSYLSFVINYALLYSLSNAFLYSKHNLNIGGKFILRLIAPHSYLFFFFFCYWSCYYLHFVWYIFTWQAQSTIST